MKSVLISIQPKWCELIASGKKTVEVRKTKPKLETPFKVYIYCTQGEALAYPCLNNPKFAIHRKNNSTLQGRQMTAKERERSDHSYANGKVIGEFVCETIDNLVQYGIGVAVTDKDNNLKKANVIREKSCLTDTEICNYLDEKDGYAWHISNLVIYDEPRELSEFVVEGDCLNGDCKKCKWFDGGNNYNVEADCLLPYDFHFEKTVKPLFRPPQSWCYVESEVDTE